MLLCAFGAHSLMASVVVTPSSANLNPGRSIQFSATGSASGVYLWSLSGSGCDGITCGMITSSGYYTAPNVAPAVEPIIVTATSFSDLSQSGTATVTVGNQPVISVSVSPSQVSLALGAQQVFTATVTGTSNTAVGWSLSGAGCNGATCGLISDNGTYTAPTTMPSIPTVTVKATSKADGTKSATATVALISPVTVTVSPASAKLFPGGKQKFSAQVTGSVVTTVTWSVSGAGCSGSTCGTITTAGSYTAPVAVPNPATVTVKATSTADANSFGTATVTILTPVSVAISPTSVAVISGEQVQFQDTVTGTTNTAVKWSVSGSSCSGSACGTVSSAGLYTSPTNISAPMEVNVTVTLQAYPNVSASALVSILRANNAKLSGHYAFQFLGFDNNGIHQMAGSIVADGKGVIPSGYEDVNDIINPSTKMAITGTYEIRSDNRGAITLAGPLGTQTMRVALNADGTKGRLISFDQTGIRGSGVIYLQDTSAFDASLLYGGYVLCLTGVDKRGARIGALGLIFPDGSGLISGSSLDVNENGVVPPTFATFSGTYDVDATGRGTMTLNIPDFKGGVFHFAFYVVSQKQLLLVSTDPISTANPIFSGPAVLQSALQFDSASFVGNAIFGASGSTGSNEDVSIGRIGFKPNNVIAWNYDRNAGGVVTIGGALTGAYTVQVNGRATMNLNSGHTWLLYATSPDAGFLMDMSSSGVRIGEVVRQVSVPFSNATLVGTYMAGSGEPVVKTAPLYSGDMNFDGSVGKTGSGAVSGMEDISQTSSLLTDQVISGAYALSTVSKNGLGYISLTSPANMNYRIWVASPSEAFGVQVDANAILPTVLYIEQ